MCSSNCPCGVNVGRRAFIGRGALGTLGAAVLAACGDRDIGGTYPLEPFPTEPLTIKLSDFPQLSVAGGIARVDGGSAQPVALVRTGESSFTAISLICPHQGAVVEITGSPTFRCPSHLAEFAADGTWTGGRETADLTALGVTFDAARGTITINGPVAAGPLPSLMVSPSTEVFTATVGAPSPAAQTVAVTNTGGGILSGLDVVVAYGGGSPGGWLKATFDQRTAPATLTLTPNSATLAPGAYTATVQITAPTALNAPQAVTVTLLVAQSAAPRIAAAPAAVSFAAVVGGANPPTQQVAITNGGGGNLTGLSVGQIVYGGGAGWLTAVLSATGAPTVLTLTASRGTLGAGTYTATVPIVAAGAGNSPFVVNVTFTVAPATAAPSIALSTSTASFSAPQGGGSTAPQTINIQNGGGGTLGPLAVLPVAYGSGGTGWLSAVLSSTNAPTTLTLTAQPLSLPAGTYTATISITSTGVANSPQTVAVTLTVGATSGLVVSPTSVALTAAVGSSPGGQVVNITSSGPALSGVTFNISYGAGATGWLSGSTLSATATPAALTLRAAANALAAGNYSATVQITAPGAATRAVAVTLAVTQAGLAVVIANWPTLATVGGIAGSVGVVQGTPTAVVRTGPDTFAAFSMRCPHQGTTIRVENWRSTGSAFHCPNHDALFDAAGRLLASSPQRTTNLVTRTVRYTPGDTTLYIT